MIAPWIISHFPQHRIYVEPFGGAGSVLLRKPRAYAEVWNDLDHDVVNLFRVLRSSDANRLIESLRLTPYAREEFKESYDDAINDLEKARRLIIRSFMGFGSDGHNDARPTGFRANSNRSGTTPAHDWVNYPDALTNIVNRMQGLVIENRPGLQVMASHDGPQTLHYVDPPYLHSTRKSSKSERKSYRHELTDEQHVELLLFLSDLKGHVVLSGYPSELYDAMLESWKRIERPHIADGGAKRTEVLWIKLAQPQA